MSSHRRFSIVRLRYVAILAVLGGSALLFAACGNGSIGDGKGGSTSSAGGAGGVAHGGGGAGGTSGGGSTAQGGSSQGGGGAGRGGSGGAGGAGRDFSTDRNKFFGASRCDKAHVLLCEDFESGTLDTNTWQVNGDTPVIDSVQHARGSKALHITKPMNGYSFIRETKTFPVANNRYWGRSFVYFKSLPTAPGMSYAHWTFTAASGSGSDPVKGEIRLSGQLSGGKNLFGVGTDTGMNNPIGSGDWTNSDNDPPNMAKAVPTGQWLCIEWLHDGQNNVTQFYWDAVHHPSLDTSATVHGTDMQNPYTLPQFTNVWLGWDEYQPSSETFEMWLDEVAIDTDRIGCVL
jgi:hypothetical protein